MSGEKGPEVGSFSNPEAGLAEREQIGSSSDSDIVRQHESIVAAWGWVYAEPRYYNKARSEAFNRKNGPDSEHFDDTLGEYAPSGAAREGAGQDVWQYALNKAGVSIEEMYELTDEANHRAWPELDN